MPTELERLSTFFGESTITGKMIFGIKKRGKPIDLLSIALDNEVKEGFRTIFLKRVGQLQEYKTVVSYNPNAFGADEVHKLSFSAIPKASELIKDATGKVWAFDKTFIKRIKFIVFRFKNSNQDLVYIFKYYPKTKFLAKHNAYIFTGGTLKFSKSNIIGLAPSIDCITCGEEMLVVNRNQFEKIFDYSQLYLNSANSLFEKFGQNTEFKIVDIDTMKNKLIKSLGRLRRLNDIYTSENYSKYTLEMIKRINTDKSLGIIFSGTGRDKTVTFPSVNVFMDVYEDAYLESVYTNEKYKALSKRKL
jgi:hypothetical protein